RPKVFAHPPCRYIIATGQFLDKRLIESRPCCCLNRADESLTVQPRKRCRVSVSFHRDKQISARLARIARAKDIEHSADAWCVSIRASPPKNGQSVFRGSAGHPVTAQPLQITR